jgi:probable phosphoglycerate mutase
MLVAYIDGGSRGNPGPAGYGVRIEEPDGTVHAELRGALGTVTNNVAEYRGLIAALTFLVDTGRRQVLVKSDSQLLVRQMRGEYRVRHPGLRRLHQEASALVTQLEQARFEHVPRASNTEADRLANLAMDEAEAEAETEAKADPSHPSGKSQ